ncbi:MAG: DUF4118 domain-containing protein [Candidatus Spyradenecus sp.]
MTPTPQPLLGVAKAPAAGRLKIFFGFAAGVGKTYAMLEAAQAAARSGVDVVAGYIEPHARAETNRLQSGLERLPLKEVHHGGIVLKEFNLDAALARHPALLLVDELAHTNAPGSRHAKRYQDIDELLRHGIDVYTTVNVQHIESLHDIVAAISGISVRERIPDSVFDEADQVELIDLEPQTLLARLSAGKIYAPGQAQRARLNFFTEDNLASLREIALRRCADRLSRLPLQARYKQKGSSPASEHILACLSPAPSNAAIIRTAARMARAFNATFSALYVETAETAALGLEDKKRLRRNRTLARELGATIETVYGDNVPRQIAEFAKSFRISKIVIGRSAATRGWFGRTPLTDQLLELAPHIEIHIIPDLTRSNGHPLVRTLRHPRGHFPKGDLLKSAGLLFAASLIGILFDRLGFTEANIITVYLLCVVVIAVKTEWRGSSLLASILSVLAFNFLFTEPRYSLRAYNSGYPVTFVVMFFAALLTGTLASRLNLAAKRSAETAFKTRVLLDTNQLLRRERSNEDIADILSGQLAKLLKRKTVIFLLSLGRLSPPRTYTTRGHRSAEKLSAREQSVAAWVLQNQCSAGATTDTLSGATYLYFPLRAHTHLAGVVGIDMAAGELDTFERSLVISIIDECALAMAPR